jgi:hypothetical protein
MRVLILSGLQEGSKFDTNFSEKSSKIVPVGAPFLPQF